MISKEPIITIGLLEQRKEIRGEFHGLYQLPNSIRLEGSFHVLNVKGVLVLFDAENIEVYRAQRICCTPLQRATFVLDDVVIGINFHWERKECHTFEGSLILIGEDGDTITALNEIGVESYLKSVISSEMSAEAPLEFLKAQAITSRSWLVAMLQKQKEVKRVGVPSPHAQETEHEIIRWYDREDHAQFDVCADDHCQRYHGITKIISPSAEEAVNSTRGQFLIYDSEICDARFSKACGGRTELFEHAWEEISIPYLQSVPDSSVEHPGIERERDATAWITSCPEAYCNTTSAAIVKHILPAFDRETTDFFRWKIEYTREQLEEIISQKSGIDFGTLMDLVPLQRGPSGRLYLLKIVGSKRTVSVGKELEIRRWLSSSHLYSSAFIVQIERDNKNIPTKFIFNGAGWGHGVGLCQIGAAVMATHGRNAEEIVRHYFRTSELRTLY